MKISAVDILNKHSEEGTLDIMGVAKKVYPTLKLVNDNTTIFIGNNFIFQSNNIENVELVLFGLIAGNQQDEVNTLKERIDDLENQIDGYACYAKVAVNEIIVKESDECQFEPTTNTSSATICKHCGREKFLHTT